MNYLGNNDNISFNARIYWNSKNSRKFAKDFPELKNMMKHHMGGDNVTHYIQYDKDIFILSSTKEINNSSKNSYSTGIVGYSKDDIKKTFRKHFNKYKSLNNMHKADNINDTNVVKISKPKTLQSFFKQFFKRNL